MKCLICKVDLSAVSEISDAKYCPCCTFPIAAEIIDSIRIKGESGCYRDPTGNFLINSVDIEVDDENMLVLCPVCKHKNRMPSEEEKVLRHCRECNSELCNGSISPMAELFSVLYSLGDSKGTAKGVIENGRLETLCIKDRTGTRKIV